MKTLTVYNEDGTVAKAWIGVGSSSLAGGPVPILVLTGMLSADPIGFHALKPGQYVEVSLGELQ